MNLSEIFATVPNVVLLVAAGVLSTLFVVLFLLIIEALRRLRRLETLQRDVISAVTHEVTVRSPARAAVAAVIVANRSHEITIKDIETEVKHLLDHWEQVEDMVEEVSTRLNELEKRNGKT